jgi:tetratricopeptide (TPR) repeat protein
MSSKKKKPGRRAGGHRPAGPSRALAEALEAARNLFDEDRLEEALSLLHDLDRRHPNTLAVLELLSDVASRADRWAVALDANERLAVLEPNDATVLFNRGMTHVACGFLVLAQRYFQQMLLRWPEFDMTDRVHDTLERLATEVEKRLAGLDVPPGEALEVEARLEQMQVWLVRGKFSEARRVAQQLLSRWPRFLPALNAVADAWYQEGNLAQAITAVRQAVQVVPENSRGQALLVRFLVLASRADEARQEAEALRTRPVQHPDDRVAAAEALTILGDDAGVLAVWAQAEQEGFQLSDERLALLHHLAAVAAYRQGDEERARGLWARALKADSDHELTEANIEDLDRPAEEQTGPWPLPVDAWLPSNLLGELFRRAGRAPVAGRHRETETQLQRFLGQHPPVVQAARLLLEHGDPVGCELAVRMAGSARTPDLLAALRDFALGRHGTDRLRYQAAFSVAPSGLLPGGTVRLWRGGAWQDVPVPVFEVSRDPLGKPNLSRRGEKLAFEALTALREERDAERAEQLLRQALLENPDEPSLSGNLYNALMIQGREPEAYALMEELHRKHPDYLFGAVHLARKAIEDRQLDEVLPLVEPFLKRPRLHATELTALALVHIELAMARKQREEAWRWYQLMESVDPDDPQLGLVRAKLGLDS